MRTLSVLFFVIFLLSGCALDTETKSSDYDYPSGAEIASADFGSYPSDYKNVIESYMAQQLKDPYSAQYDCLNQPIRAWNGWRGVEFGYAVCVNINAKNSFGAYTGSSPYYFMINNEQIVKVIESDGDPYMEPIVSEACQKILSPPQPNPGKAIFDGLVSSNTNAIEGSKAAASKFFKNS